MKKVFYSKDFKGVHPVGVCAIVVANDEEEARTLLKAELKAKGLPESEFTLQRVSRAEVGAIIINNGDY